MTMVRDRFPYWGRLGVGKEVSRGSSCFPKVLFGFQLAQCMVSVFENNIVLGVTEIEIQNE